MHEFIHKNSKRFLAGIGALLLSFSSALLPVFAFGSNWMNSGAYKSIGYYQGVTYSNQNAGQSDSKYYRAISVTTGAGSNTYPNVDTVGVVAWSFKSFKDRNTIDYTQLNLLFYSFESGWSAVGQYSNNNLSWSDDRNRVNISLTRTPTGQNGEGTTVYYGNITMRNMFYVGSWNGDYYINLFHKVFPNIPIIYGCASATDIVDVISLDVPISQAPWTMSTSSGGMHFGDGTNLDDSNTAIYSNVYTVMDINQDNSISSEEVNYYNVTYDTNYDYSTINNDTDFDLYDFLYYVALKVTAGENPAGEGSGQGSQNTTTGGITIGDGSFTQTQSQSIEQNAVNVTVTNNNELTQENLNEINNIINNENNPNSNTFQEAISNINYFRAIAIAFATLAGVVLGWLPAWVTGLLGLAFSLLAIMIVFRLIHLFV